MVVATEFEEEDFQRLGKRIREWSLFDVKDYEAHLQTHVKLQYEMRLDITDRRNNINEDDPDVKESWDNLETRIIGKINNEETALRRWKMAKDKMINFFTSVDLKELNREAIISVPQIREQVQTEFTKLHGEFREIGRDIWSPIKKDLEDWATQWGERGKRPPSEGGSQEKGSPDPNPKRQKLEISDEGPSITLQSALTSTVLRDELNVANISTLQRDFPGDMSKISAAGGSSFINPVRITEADPSPIKSSAGSSVFSSEGNEIISGIQLEDLNVARNLKPDEVGDCDPIPEENIGMRMVFFQDAHKIHFVEKEHWAKILEMDKKFDANNVLARKFKKGETYVAKGIPVNGKSRNVRVTLDTDPKEAVLVLRGRNAFVRMKVTDFNQYKIIRTDDIAELEAADKPVEPVKFTTVAIKGLANRKDHTLHPSGKRPSLHYFSQKDIVDMRSISKGGSDLGLYTFDVSILDEKVGPIPFATIWRTLEKDGEKETVLLAKVLGEVGVVGKDLTLKNLPACLKYNRGLPCKKPPKDHLPHCCWVCGGIKHRACDEVFCNGSIPGKREPSRTWPSKLHNGKWKKEWENSIRDLVFLP